MAVSINTIKNEFENQKIENINELFEKYKYDNRKGIINIIKTYKKKYDKYKFELQRIDNMLSYERDLYDEGYEFIAGIDEVGRGSLAGPVVTASVILSKNSKIIGINDSKKLSEKQRNELYDIIIDKAISYSFGIITSYEIDNINILQSTYKAMKNSIENLSVKPDFILVDALKIPDINIRQKSIIKGDSKSVSIAAASIIAKVKRDEIMVKYSKLYPNYHFDKNKGYGSNEHIEALKMYSYCKIHRKSFIKNIINEY